MDDVLSDIKRLLGIEVADTSFDAELLLHINTVSSFSLPQFGISAIKEVEEGDGWDDIFSEGTPYSGVKTYIFLKVKSLFDPPTHSFVLESLNRQIQEMEWRLVLEIEQNSEGDTV